MREIKFRVWQKLFGGWIELKKIVFAEDDSTIIGFIDKDGEPYGTKEIEIMQYTGYKDKNGKEIYEGDILIDEFNRKLLVEWWQGSFALKAISETNFKITREIFQWFDNEKYFPKIIGNRWENPKLLSIGNEVEATA